MAGRVSRQAQHLECRLSAQRLLVRKHSLRPRRVVTACCLAYVERHAHRPGCWSPAPSGGAESESADVAHVRQVVNSPSSAMAAVLSVSFTGKAVHSARLTVRLVARARGPAQRGGASPPSPAWGGFQFGEKPGQPRGRHCAAACVAMRGGRERAVRGRCCGVATPSRRGRPSAGAVVRWVALSIGGPARRDRICGPLFYAAAVPLAGVPAHRPTGCERSFERGRGASFVGARGKTPGSTPGPPPAVLRPPLF
jgi:hypothetical protein